MKRILLGDLSADLLGTLEIILKHWGYRALVTSRPREFAELLEGSNPDLVLVGNAMLRVAEESLHRALQGLVDDRNLPLVLLAPPSEQAALETSLRLDTPVDIFALFELVQKHLERHPRRNLRLEVRIPGMVCRDRRSELAEVLSISTRGLFIKTTYRLEPQDRFQVIFPLMGMKQELELSGRAVYRMEPRPEHNYRQGVGLEFTELDDETRLRLEAFVEQRLLSELSESQRGAELDRAVLCCHPREKIPRALP